MKNKKREEKEKIKKDSVSEPILEDEEIGSFSSWLRSGAGVEYMRIFVVLNSLIVFMTMAWPQMEQFYIHLKAMLFE